MSFSETRGLRNDVSEAVVNTPVEIWREIIDHALFDQILYLINPFYPGCNLHTALDDFSNHQRLLELAYQRGNLRLVSRSWRDAVDVSPWQYFEPYRDGSKNLGRVLAQSQLASRLEFHDSWEDHILVDARVKCGPCLKQQGFAGYYLRENLFNRLKNTPLTAKIFRLPHWHDYRDYLEPHEGQNLNPLPHLQALFLKVYSFPTPDVLDLFGRLEFLSFWLDFMDWDIPVEIPQDFHFPVLKALQTKILDPLLVNFLAKWKMPLLAHLHLMSISSEETLPSLSPLVEGVGANLISLRISSAHAFIRLPDNIWEEVPRLEYLGVSRVETLVSPPLGHPLHTFANLEGLDLSSARVDTNNVIQNWETLSTIAELHDWNDAPGDFAYSWDKNHDPSHEHSSKFCWLCVDVSYILCRQRGLRYEDSSGRTFGEVWPARAVFE